MTSEIDAHSHEPVPDSFEVGDWRVRWCGWREPANQLEVFGVWVAMPSSPRWDSEHVVTAWVSCTLGGCHQYRAFEVLNTDYYKDHGKRIYPWSSEVEKLTAKREALKRLIISLKLGHSFRVDGDKHAA